MRKRTNKRGVEMALSALIGTILSILALYVLFNLFTSFLLSSSENEDIAEQNAKSIAEFVNYHENSDRYKTINSCYALLNLQRYQYYQVNDDSETDNRDNYFYVIDQRGVWVYSINQYQEVISSPQKRPQEVSRNCFDSNCDEKYKIYIDTTDDGWTFAVDALFTQFGAKDTQLSLEEQTEAIIVIMPSFDNQNSYEITYRNSNGGDQVTQTRNSQLLGDFNYDSPNLHIPKGKNLVFDKKNNGIFVTSHSVSDMYVSQELCAFKDLNNRDLQLFFNSNPNEIDPNVYDIIVTYPQSEVSFEWRNKLICKQNGVEINCNNLDDLFKGDIMFKDFLVNVKSFYEKNLTSYSENLLVIRTEGINREEFMGRENIPEFNTVFQEVDLEEQITEENTQTLEGWIWNQEVNECNSNECNTVYNIDGATYFYLENKNSFYRFNHLSLRKSECTTKECTIHYPGINNQDKEVSEVEKANENYILRDLPVKDNNRVINYDIVISNRQYINIPEFNN